MLFVIEIDELCNCVLMINVAPLSIRPYVKITMLYLLCNRQTLKIHRVQNTGAVAITNNKNKIKLILKRGPHMRNVFFCSILIMVLPTYKPLTR